MTTGRPGTGDGDEQAWQDYDETLWLSGVKQRRGPMTKAAFIAGRESMRREQSRDPAARPDDQA